MTYRILLFFNTKILVDKRMFRISTYIQYYLANDVHRKRAFLLGNFSFFCKKQAKKKLTRQNSRKKTRQNSRKKRNTFTSPFCNYSGNELCNLNTSYIYNYTYVRCKYLLRFCIFLPLFDCCSIGNYGPKPQKQ